MYQKDGGSDEREDEQFDTHTRKDLCCDNSRKRPAINPATLPNTASNTHKNTRSFQGTSKLTSTKLISTRLMPRSVIYRFARDKKKLGEVRATDKTLY